MDVDVDTAAIIIIRVTGTKYQPRGGQEEEEEEECLKKKKGTPGLGVRIRG